jgi:hypothetical protein
MPDMEKVEFEFPDEKLEKEESSKSFRDDDEPEAKQADAKEPNQVSVNEDEGEDDVDIEVVDDTPPRDRNRKPSEPPSELTEEELSQYSEKVRKRLQHFTKGYHDERRAKEAALRQREELERLTAQLVEENKKLKGTVNKNQEVLLEQAKKSVAAELDQAKKAYKDAYDAGNSEAMIAAQESLMSAKMRAEKIANIKIPALQEEDNDVQIKPTTPTPVDTRAVEWAKANTWFGQDDEMTSYALGLHNKLVKENVDPQSDRYYEMINSRMRQLFPDRFEGEVEEPTEKPRRKASVVAPATRSTASKKIKLTNTQVAYARKYNIPLDEYAKQVAKLERTQNG